MRLKFSSDGIYIGCRHIFAILRNFSFWDICHLLLLSMWVYRVSLYLQHIHCLRPLLLNHFCLSMQSRPYIIIESCFLLFRDTFFFIFTLSFSFKVLSNFLNSSVVIIVMLLRLVCISRAPGETTMAFLPGDHVYMCWSMKFIQSTVTCPVYQNHFWLSMILCQTLDVGMDLADGTLYSSRLLGSCLLFLLLLVVIPGKLESGLKIPVAPAFCFQGK